MTYFVWGDDLNIDNGPIDDDHRKIVAYVNELHTATSDGHGQAVVGEVLGRLIAYTKEHFEREERQMEIHRFQQLGVHKQQHTKLLKEVSDLKGKFDAGSITVASQVSTLLRDWLSIHIRRDDKALVRYIKNL